MSDRQNEPQETQETLLNVETVGPNGEPFTFENIPESLADFSQLSDAQGETLRNIMSHAAESGYSSVDYQEYMASPDRAELVQVQEPQGRENITGYMGEVVRGLGDEAAAMGAGAAIGSVVPGVGTVAGAGAGLAAKVGTDAFVGLTRLGNRLVEALGGEPLDLSAMQTSDELWNNIMDRLGVEKADTPAEEIFAMGMAAGGDAMSMALGVGPTVARGAFNQAGMRMANPTTAQRVGEVLSTGPMSQTTGAMAGEATGEIAGQFAEQQGAEPWAQQAARFGGAFLGDTLLGGTAGAFADNRLAARRANPAAMPEFQDVQAINEVYAPQVATMDDGTPVRINVDPRQREPVEAMTNEVIMANRPTQAERTRVRRQQAQKGGTADAMFNRDYAGQQVVTNLADEYTIDAVDLDLNDMTPRLRRLGQDYVEARNQQYRNALGIRENAIKQMDQAGSVPTTKVQQQIAEELELIARQDPQEFSQLANTMQNWQGLVSGGMDINQALTELKIIQGHQFPEGLTRGAEGLQKQMVKRIKDALRDDIYSFAEDSVDPDVFRRFRESQEVLGDLAEDFKVQTLSRLLKDFESGGSVDFASIGDLIRPNTNPEDFARMVRRLDDTGKASLRDALMADMFRQANPRSPDVSGFVDQLNLRDPLIQRAFDEDDIEHILTVRRALEVAGIPAQNINRPGSVAGRASFGTNPAAGPYAAQQTGRIGPAALLAGELYQRASGKLARNAQTPQARDLAIRLRNIPPGSAGERNLARRLLRVIAGLAPGIPEAEGSRNEAQLDPGNVEMPEGGSTEGMTMRERRGLPPVETGREEYTNEMAERRGR